MATNDKVTASDETNNHVITAEAAVKAIKAGRKNDVDIAAQIISDYADQGDGESWSLEEEKKLIRRVDWRLIPTVCCPGLKFMRQVMKQSTHQFSTALYLRDSVWSGQDCYLRCCHLQH